MYISKLVQLTCPDNCVQCPDCFNDNIRVSYLVHIKLCSDLGFCQVNPAIYAGEVSSVGVIWLLDEISRVGGCAAMNWLISRRNLLSSNGSR